MNIKKLLITTMASIVSSFAVADQGDVLITFSTPGPDKYADGSVVSDGEWYALAWVPEGQAFGGLTTACQPIVEGQELILAAPLAKDGRCPFTAFEFAQDDKYAKGSFSIFLLDTRNQAGEVAARGANKLPVLVAGESVAMTAAKGSAMTIEATASGAAGAEWAQSQLQSDVVPVKISAFEIVGANVQLTVANLTPGANYIVKTGAKVDELNTFVVPKISETDSATVIIPKEKGNYFSLVSQPLSK